MQPTLWRQVELQQDSRRLITHIQETHAIVGRRVSFSDSEWTVASVFGEPVQEPGLPYWLDEDTMGQWEWSSYL